MTRIMILGAVLVALPLLNLAVRWIAIHLFGRAIGRHAVDRQPDTIQLTNAPANVWRKPEAAAALAKPLLSTGFEDAGTYTIAEMPGVIVRLMVQPRESQFACVYEHPRAGTWLELVTRFADSRIACFSTLPPTGLKPRPGHLMVNAPGSSPESLHSRSLEQRPMGVMAPVSRDRVVQLFQQGYAESIAWRKQAGVSVAEVAAVASRRKAA